MRLPQTAEQKERWAGTGLADPGVQQPGRRRQGGSWGPAPPSPSGRGLRQPSPGSPLTVTQQGHPLTLWQVLGPEDLQTEMRSAEGHADRPKQVAFDVLLVFRGVFSLQLQYNQI